MSGTRIAPKHTLDGQTTGDTRSDIVNPMPTWLGFIWTSPNTLLGLLLGALTFQRPRLSEGALIFDRAPRGLTALMLTFNRAAMTIGFVIVSTHPVTGRLLAHERYHIKQYCAWGPLFIPVYLLLAIPFGYRRHPMEIRAQIAAGERPPPRSDEGGSAPR
jgi:hypothetical protein